MAATDSSRFGDPRSGYAQHHPHPHPQSMSQHHYAAHPHHPQQVVSGAGAAVPAGIPQQSPGYPHPAQPQPQQHAHAIPPHHQQQPPPPHPPSYGTNGPLDGSVALGGGGAAVPNGRYLPGPSEAQIPPTATAMDSSGGGSSLLHPSYAGMPQPHQHQHPQHHPIHQQQQHHPQPPLQHHQQQFYGAQPSHMSHPHHPHMGTGVGEMGGGLSQQHQHQQQSLGHPPPLQQQSQMGPPGMLPPPALAPGAGVYVPAPPPVAFPVEPQLDFSQIYRLFNMSINSSPLTASPESISDVDPSSRGKKFSSIPPSTWNLMLQSALDGLRSLDPIVADKYGGAVRDTQAPEIPELYVVPEQGANGAAAGEQGVNGAPNGAVEDDEGPDAKKRRQDEKGAEPQECLTCHAKSSPEWRRGPFGPRTLCNACGLVYIKIMKRRAKGLPDEDDENGGDGDGDDGSGSDD
ncbi:hypothetical protein FRB90_004642 [Tulasnella sp. 427]|nr:hypothetical protein FRB90_004642 [Tulasnella sp. 427]